MHHIAFKEKKIITSVISETSDGSFALDEPPHRFETCRERFGIRWNEDTIGFFFTHPVDKGYSVATFLKKTEMVLKQTEFSQYALTNRDKILWVEPSPFWKSCRMKRSLLTILLRAGILYDPKADNYEQALFAEKFVHPTKSAVMRFLFGFTKYVGPSIDDQVSIESRGWKHVFDGQGSSFIQNCLKWPEQKDAYVPQGPVSKTALWV